MSKIIKTGLSKGMPIDTVENPIQFLNEILSRGFECCRTLDEGQEVYTPSGTSDPYAEAWVVSNTEAQFAPDDCSFAIGEVVFSEVA